MPITSLAILPTEWAAEYVLKQECVGVGFHHHHAEIVAVIHLFEGFGFGDAFALALLPSKQFGVALTAVSLTVVTQVDDLHACQVKPEACGALLDHLFVAEQHGDKHALFVQAMTAALSILSVLPSPNTTRFGWRLASL